MSNRAPRWRSTKSSWNSSDMSPARLTHRTALPLLCEQSVAGCRAPGGRAQMPEWPRLLREAGRIRSHRTFGPARGSASEGGQRRPNKQDPLDGLQAVRERRVAKGGKAYSLPNREIASTGSEDCMPRLRFARGTAPARGPKARPQAANGTRPGTEFSARHSRFRCQESSVWRDQGGKAPPLPEICQTNLTRRLTRGAPAASRSVERRNS